MKDRIEVVASGFGGQGVVRLGQILGEAMALKCGADMSGVR
jgi:Pyruvate/2-oxoacid:ferredoxin oxidoreductase gamma subunit